MSQNFDPSRHDAGQPVFDDLQNLDSALSARIYEFRDASASDATRYTMSAGDSFHGDLSTFNDEDWIAVNLDANVGYSVELRGQSSFAGTLLDPVLRIFSSDAEQIAFDDDSGTGRDSALTFSVETSGTYYISVEAFSAFDVGSYRVDFDEATPPGRVGTVAERADYLILGPNNAEYSFDTSQSNVITVNLTGLTLEGRQLARWAMDAWEMVADINFVEVVWGEMITVDDESNGAYAFLPGTGSDSDGVELNVSTAWLDAFGTTLDSYSFQTYVHEFGHALGLNHQGNYNGNGTYQVDATFTNDSWQSSVMSYFSQTDNYTVDASFAYLSGAMMVDVYAIQELYGAPGSSGATAGNTVYGRFSNLGNYMDQIFATMATGQTNARIGDNQMAFTIYDQGGTDLVNLSFLTASERADINLNDGTFSDIGAGIGVMGIALGTTVENLITGAGNDRVQGNEVRNVIDARGGNDVVDAGAGNDIVNGGSGNDVLTGSLGNDQLSGDAGNDRLNGGDGNDVLSGGSGNDALFGNTGADVLTGGDGFDAINGGEGNDNLIGGLGNDRLTGSTGDDSLNGGSGNDRLNGNSGNDRLAGDAGIDILNGGDGQDTLSGGSGNDNLQGSLGDDSLSGDANNDVLNGGDGSDTLSGGSGNDNLQGSQGDDLLVGGADNDILNGGIGDDVLSGGTGTDTFIFTDGFGNDEINDFEAGQVNETIDLRTLGADSPIVVTQVGGNTVVQVGSDSITLTNIDKSDLLREQFEVSSAHVALNTTSVDSLSIGNAWWADREKHVADVNGDGLADIIGLTGIGSGQISVRLGQADGTFAEAPTVTDNRFGNAWWADREKHIADVNGDGRADIIGLTGIGSGQISVRLGQADGTFADDATVTDNRFGNAWWADREKHIADVNGDGRADIIGLTGIGSGQISVRLGQADGTFADDATVTDNKFGNAWWADREKHIADVNGDGRADIIGLTGNGSGQISVRFGQADGSFADDAVVSDNKFGNAWWADREKHIADVNGDGFADIIGFTGIGSGQIAVRLGLGDGTFADTAGVTDNIFGGSEWADREKYFSDVDGDGFVDFVGLTGENGPNVFTSAFDVNEVDFIF